MKYLKKKEAKNLFEKYLNGNCSLEERRLVDNFLDSYQVDSRDGNDSGFHLGVEEKLWQKIREKTLTEKKIRPFGLEKSWLKYAAVIIGVAVSLLAFHRFNSQGGENLDIKPGVVVLHTANGSNNLSENETGTIADGAGNPIASVEEGALRYKKDLSTKEKEVEYHAIEVPLGKTYKLFLSDGTLVHLNAGTNLRFPIKFIPNTKREVFLNGEAYFEVIRDQANPFMVMAGDMEVTVLGTHFNVSSYKGDKQHTVLVEGSVSVDNLGANPSFQRSIVIKPGQKAIMVPEGLNVNEVDVEDYIGWIRNILTFNNELFPDIISKIERKYNVEIENNFKELDTARFNGKFGEESIISLMDTFKESANFDYVIKAGKIIINKKNERL